MFELAILDKVRTIGDTPVDNQFGFKKASSTDQCIFLLKERIRRYVHQYTVVFWMLLKYLTE